MTILNWKSVLFLGIQFLLYLTSFSAKFSLKNLSMTLLSQGFALLVTMPLIRGVTKPLPKTRAITNWKPKNFKGESNPILPGLLWLELSHCTSCNVSKVILLYQFYFDLSNPTVPAIKIISEQICTTFKKPNPPPQKKN